MIEKFLPNNSSTIEENVKKSVSGYEIFNIAVEIKKIVFVCIGALVLSYFLKLPLIQLSSLVGLYILVSLIQIFSRYKSIKSYEKAKNLKDTSLRVDFYKILFSIIHVIGAVIGFMIISTQFQVNVLINYLALVYGGIFAYLTIIQIIEYNLVKRNTEPNYAEWVKQTNKVRNKLSAFSSIPIYLLVLFVLYKINTPTIVIIVFFLFFIVLIITSLLKSKHP